MTNKEQEKEILVIDCVYDMSKIAEEVASYVKQGYTLFSHSVYKTSGLSLTKVSLIFIKNTHQ